jgi:hypothetical protein
MIQEILEEVSPDSDLHPLLFNGWTKKEAFRVSCKGEYNVDLNRDLGSGLYEVQGIIVLAPRWVSLSFFQRYPQQASSPRRDENHAPTGADL